MGHAAPFPLRSLVNQGYFQSLFNIDSEVGRLKQALTMVRECAIEKPARLYYAYRNYTLDFGIHQLKIIYLISTPSQQGTIASLLNEYISTKQSFIFKI